MSLVQVLINGLLLGSEYALLAVGYTLVFGVARLLTLAQGEIFVASSVLAALAMRELGAPLWVACLIAVAAGGLGGLLTDVLCFRPLVGRSHLAPAVATVGLAIAIHSGVVLLAGSSDTIPLPIAVGTGDLRIGSLLVSGIELVTLGLATALMIGIRLFVSRTDRGAALRAMAEDHEAAQLVGIDVRAVTTVMLVTSGLLAGLAGIMFALRNASVNPVAGLRVGLAGLAVMAIGGMGNVTGAMLAGIALGLADAVADFYDFGGIEPAFVWILVLVALLIRTAPAEAVRP